MSDDGDRGQSAVILLVVVGVLAAAMLQALVEFGGAAQERTRAQSAADAAALASVQHGRDIAALLAGRHGGTLVSWERHGFDVVVVVRVGDATATARATNQP